MGNLDKLPRALRMVVETLDRPETATRLSKRVTTWLEEKATPSEVAQFYIDVAQVAMAEHMLDAVNSEGSSKRVLPVFLIGKQRPAEWVLEHGTFEQKKELVAKGELPASVLDSEILEAEVVEAEVIVKKVERADA